MHDLSHPSPSRGQGARAFLVSVTGTTLEWYDFALYSAASALIFGQVFFHSEDPVAGAIAAFSTYAVGYVARPIGGILFGRLGDRIGRKKVLMWTLILIGVATLGVGLIPAYAHIGVWAPVLLVSMRLLQGVGVGGEWAGAVLVSAEHGDPGRRGLLSSAAQMGPPLGNLLANGVLALLALMPQEAFLAWGWRVGFLASILLIGVGLAIRMSIEETPVFQAIQEQGLVPETPIASVLRHEKRALAAATMVRVAPDVMYAMSTVFVLTYATLVHGLSRSEALLAVVIGSACQAFMIPAAGALSDRYNRRLVSAVGAVMCIGWPFVAFPVMSRGFVGVVVAVVLGLLCNSTLYGPQAALVSEQFQPHLRYAGSSLAYTLGGVFGGAIAPLMFTTLWGAYHAWSALAAYIIVVAVVTLVGTLLARDPDHADDELLVSRVSEARV